MRHLGQILKDLNDHRMFLFIYLYQIQLFLLINWCNNWYLFSNKTGLQMLQIDEIFSFNNGHKGRFHIVESGGKRYFFKKTQILVFWFFISSNFGFVIVDALLVAYVDIDQDIHYYKSKVGNEK